MVIVNFDELGELELFVLSGSEVALVGVQHLGKVFGGDGDFEREELDELAVELGHSRRVNFVAEVVLLAVEELLKLAICMLVYLMAVVKMAVLQPFREVDVRFSRGSLLGEGLDIGLALLKVAFPGAKLILCYGFSVVD